MKLLPNSSEDARTLSTLGVTAFGLNWGLDPEGSCCRSCEMAGVAVVVDTVVAAEVVAASGLRLGVLVDPLVQ